MVTQDLRSINTEREKDVLRAFLTGITDHFNNPYHLELIWYCIGRIRGWYLAKEERSKKDKAAVNEGAGAALVDRAPAGVVNEGARILVDPESIAVRRNEVKDIVKDTGAGTADIGARAKARKKAAKKAAKKRKVARKVAAKSKRKSDTKERTAATEEELEPDEIRYSKLARNETGEGAFVAGFRLHN